LFQVFVDLGVLPEDLSEHEFLRERKCVNSLGCDVKELRCCIKAQIVVTNVRTLSSRVRKSEPILLQRLLDGCVPDPNASAENEIHFEHLLLLIVDQSFINILAEVAGLQPVGYVVEELGIPVALRVEELLKVLEDVVEEVVNNDGTLDALGQSVEEFVVFADLAQAVVGPEVLVVLVDLPVQRWCERPILLEACQ
jgi:hypothetical protein